MKKKILIGLLMVSALSFGATNRTTTNTQRGNNGGHMISQLSESQQTEFAKEMQVRRTKNYKEGLEVRTKQLELEKLLAEDKVNWKSVEKVNKEVYEMKAEQSFEGMKYRKGIEDKYGISMGQKGKGNSRKGGGNQGHRNRDNNGNQKGKNRNK